MRSIAALLLAVAVLAACAASSSDGPASAAGGAAGAGAGGSAGAAGVGGGGAGGGKLCPDETAATRIVVAERLAQAAREMAANARADAATTCGGLTLALGCPPTTGTADPDDAEVEARCGAALACLMPLGLTAGLTTLTGGKCESSVGLYVQCENACGADVPCVDVCRDVVELSAFCVAPKVATAPAAQKDAFVAQLPLLHGVVRRLVPLGEEALVRSSSRADAWLAADGSPCAKTSQADLVTAAASLAATRTWGEQVLRASGVSP